MRKGYRGSATLEMAMIFPLVMLVFIVTLHLLFYSHDQNVLGAAAYETVTLGVNREMYTEEELEAYFYERVIGRTFLMSQIQTNITISDEKVEISCVASKDNMKLQIDKMMKMTDPEGYIRNVRKIRK